MRYILTTVTPFGWNIPQIQRFKDTITSFKRNFQLDCFRPGGIQYLTSKFGVMGLLLIRTFLEMGRKVEILEDYEIGVLVIKMN